ncbi:MAG: hypothetical protein JEY91_15670, partial [Spirochaetaceae bacterium]|nr:hypothetical protein [Spirochaetaceae bacterium]
SAIEMLNEADVQTYFLDADLSVLYDRIIKGGIPPFLEGANPLTEFKAMYQKRTALYASWADFRIDTRGLTALEVTSKILDEIA